MNLGVIDELKQKTIKCLQEVETPTPFSGESLDLSDSADAKVTELKISGNGKQETREGKNKFIPLATGNNSGLVITKNTDGTYNIVGAATTNIEHTAFVDLDKSEIENGLTYILSSTKALPEGVSCRAEMYNASWLRSFVPSITSTNSTSTGTANTTDATRVRFGIFVTSGTTINIQNLGFQLEKGTIATEYEQYGVSPSTEYSSEIESCGDNINIFNKDTSIKNKYISQAGALENSSSSSVSDYIEIKNKQYTLNVGNISGTNYTKRICFFDESKVFLSYIEEVNSVSTYVFSTPDNAKYLRFQYPNTNEEKVKLEKGSKATGYSEYGKGCINEVICNKNRLYIPDQERTISGINVKAENGKVILNGTWNTGGNWIYLNIDMTLEAGSYKNTSIRSGTAGTALPGWIVVDDDDNEYSGTHLASISKKTHLKMMKAWSNGMGTVSNYTDLTQIEKSTTATDYIEHQSQNYIIPTQQPFRAIGNIRDTFIKKNNKWYERHYIARKIFDGTESFAIVSGWGNTVYEIKIDGMLSPENNSTLGEALCSHFVIKTGSDMYYSSNVNAFAISPENLLRIRNINITTLEEFKIWLTAQYNAGTPIYVDYVLETPIDIECTEEQSTVLFDIEQNAKTYKNITHIYSTDNVSSYKEVTYKKDIETLFANTLVEEV